MRVFRRPHRRNLNEAGLRHHVGGKKRAKRAHRFHSFAIARKSQAGGRGKGGRRILKGHQHACWYVPAVFTVELHSTFDAASAWYNKSVLVHVLDPKGVA